MHIKINLSPHSCIIDQLGVNTGVTAQRELDGSCYTLVEDDPSCCPAQNTSVVHNSLISHGALQAVLTPENSVRSTCFRPESVQERGVQNPAFLTGESSTSIYADPQFDYQEQYVPDCEL